MFWLHAVSLLFLYLNTFGQAQALQLLDKEGIFAGLSSGVTIYQAVRTAQEIGEGNIVVILVDGG